VGFYFSSDRDTRVYNEIREQVMSDYYIYCCVCDKVIPHGQSHLTINTINVQREHLIPDDGCIVVDGIGDGVFECHEECIPRQILPNLERLGGKGEPFTVE